MTNEKDNALQQAVADMNALPDISGSDSERLKEFVRVTTREVKAVGGASVSTTLEMIGYIRELEHKLSPAGRTAMTEPTILDEGAVSEIEAMSHAETAKRAAGNFDNYERNNSGWICKTCGSTIAASIKYVPVWDGPFPCSGSGQVESYQLPYCPKCEVKP